MRYKKAAVQGNGAIILALLSGLINGSAVADTPIETLDNIATKQSLGSIIKPPIFVPCSVAALVTAIETANTEGSGKLRLSSFCTYAFTGPAAASVALPAITGDIEISGGLKTRLTRNSVDQFRIIDIASGAKLELENMTVDNGSISGLGGGIQNAGTLEVDKVTFQANTASNGGGLANLAGATAKITHSNFIANTAGGVGGGAIINFGKLQVVSSTISKNTAPTNGGGINTQPGGDTNIVLSNLSENTSGGLGGALSNLGTTSIYFSSITRNTGSSGGGIATGNTNVSIVKSIIKRNTPDNCNPLNTIDGCVD